MDSHPTTDGPHSLDNDVLGAADHAETLALDDTLGALSNDTLVGVDRDGEDTGLVTMRQSAWRESEHQSNGGDILSHGYLRGASLVVVAPTMQVDRHLALGSSSPGGASSGSLGTLGAGKVEAERSMY